MDVQEIREARNKGVVAFTRFCQDKKNHSDCVFCFFEGEDNKYYGPRIEQYAKYACDKIVSYNCGGRQEVLRVYNLIRNVVEYEDINKMFFIDRDYLPLTEKIQHVYQTPCYSVENFYTSKDSFSRMLSREFCINSIEADFTKCVEDYSMRQQEFHNETLYLNAWLSAQRKAEEQYHEKKISLVDYKVGRLFSEISVEKVCVKTPVVKEELLQHFPNAYDISDEEISYEIEYFNSGCPQQLFRGKFEIEFLKKIINNLKEKNKNNSYFEIKRECVYIDSNVNTLSSLSNYADTPECLVNFLQEHQCISA